MKYKLDKGRHYALTVYYIGGPKAGMGGSTECSLYDLTISVSHADGLMHETRCLEGKFVINLGIRITEDNQRR